MIRICRRDKTSLCVRGHAGSAEYGHDLICAAVSALVVTLAVNLQGFSRKKILLESGKADLACPCTPEAEPVFDCIWKGFKLLAQMYPEYLSLGGRG